MKIVGHRGARGLAPENTIASLEQALAHHVDEIEIDVRITKDNIVVLNHDATLHLPNKPAFTIADHTWEELRAYKSDAITLDMALAYINRQVPLMIEVKPRVPIEPVVHVIKTHLADGWSTRDILLGSFSQKTLRALHRALPQLETVVIERFSGLYAGYRARQLQTRRISMNHWFVWSGYSASLRHQGYQLYVYTLNRPAKARRLERHGLYGVITDHPERFVK